MYFWYVIIVVENVIKFVYYLFKVLVSLVNGRPSENDPSPALLVCTSPLSFTISYYFLSYQIFSFFAKTCETPRCTLSKYIWKTHIGCYDVLLYGIHIKNENEIEVCKIHLPNDRVANDRQSDLAVCLICSAILGAIFQAV